MRYIRAKISTIGGAPVRRLKDMQINISWDKEACVWIAECEKLGLVLESGSYDALLERVKIAIPELIELNHITERTYVISTKQQEVVCA